MTRGLGWAVRAELREEKCNAIKPVIKKILNILIAVIMVDAFILFSSMAQIMTSGRTGYWAPFWRVQAEFIIKLFS